MFNVSCNSTLAPADQTPPCLYVNICKYINYSDMSLSDVMSLVMFFKKCVDNI